MKGESQPAVAARGRVRQLGPGSEQVLKQSPSRSVRVVAAEGDRHVIVKRFESTGFSLGRDRTRARNEFELLTALHASGAPVPKPLELRATTGSAGGGKAWEVVMEWFPDAVPLQDILEGRRPWPASPERLAKALGRLVGGLHGRGLDHPDLHAGNVLVREPFEAGPRSPGGPARKGPLIAIDFHKARLTRELAPELLESHLVQLSAGTREFVSPRFRARFALAWRAALPERLRRRLPPTARLIERVEARARPLRREVVHRRQARWTRAGTAVQPIERGTGWVRVGADPERIAELQDGRPLRARDLIVQRPSVHELMNLWQVAARLYEHRIPVAAPLLLVTAPRRWMALELPDGARLASSTEVAPARAQLAALLADRGLAAQLSDEHIWVDGEGQPLIAALPALVDA